MNTAKTTDNIQPKKTAEVILSPALIPHYSLEEKTVVVIDIFRASSAICTAIGHGVKEIIPVQTLEEAYEYKQNGYIVAAERNGEVVSGFDFGNSPYSFMSEELKGKSVVLTTSNCTRAIYKAEGAGKIILGSFINISALCEYLIFQNDDFVLLCSGWKNKINLEDSVFAGAVIYRLQNNFLLDCDTAQMVLQLYENVSEDMDNILKNTSHHQRLSHLNLEKDIEYCLMQDQLDCVPVFDGRSIASPVPVMI